MTVRLNGSTSGYVEIDAPATAGSNTLVLPTGNGSADQVLSTNGSGTLSFVDRGRMVLETAQATTSGTSKDFTGIPSWVKRVTVMFRGVSTNGSSIPIIQLGTSAGIEATGYTGDTLDYNTTAASGTLYTNVSGIRLRGSISAATVFTGCIVLVTQTTDVWVSNGQVAAGSGSGSGAITFSKTLSGTLDRIRITTVNGTDTFDAGSINILYEG